MSAATANMPIAYMLNRSRDVAPATMDSIGRSWATATFGSMFFAASRIADARSDGSMVGAVRTTYQVRHTPLCSPE
jgi:hypothetical protein